MIAWLTGKKTNQIVFVFFYEWTLCKWKENKQTNSGCWLVRKNLTKYKLCCKDLFPFLSVFLSFFLSFLPKGKKYCKLKLKIGKNDFSILYSVSILILYYNIFAIFFYNYYSNKFFFWFRFQFSVSVLLLVINSLSLFLLTII